MPTSPQNITQYQSEGYTLIPNLIPAAEVAPVRKRMEQIIAGELDDTWPKGRLQVLDPTRYKNPRGGQLAAGIQSPALTDDAFAKVCNHPNLVSAFAALLGGPVQRFTDQALVKHAQFCDGQAGQTFYHQDSYYWHIEPSLGCNAWIALDNVGPGAIALALIPGSQKGWTLHEHESYYDEPAYCNANNGEPFKRHRIPAAKVDTASERIMTMKPGDAVFFTNYTWHRSEKNKTGTTLMAYAIAYKRTPAPGSAPV